MMNISKFTSGLVVTIVGIILTVTVAIPIITDNQVAESVKNSAALNSLLNIMPLLIVVGLVLGVIGMYVSGRD
jgi:hypothetical protein